MAEEEKREDVKVEEKAGEAEETLKEESEENEAMDTTSIVDAVKKKKKWGLPVLILSITFLFMILPAAVLIFSFSYAVPKKHLKEKLDLGEKYISELDYEKAILAYKEAIEMNPKSVAAYLGIADAYEALSDRNMEEAKISDAIDNITHGVDYLQSGYDKTKSNEISDRLTEMKLKKEYITIKPVALSEYPDGIRKFLNAWCWYDRDEFRGETEEELLSVIGDAFHLSFFCDYSVYPKGAVELGEEWADPRVLDADGFDWIMENVYNFDADLVKKIREEDFQNSQSQYGVQSWKYNANNNTYESFWGGVGDGPFIMVDHVEKSGNLYLVQYDVYICFQEEYEPDQVRYAILEEKTVDGSMFWSIHYDGLKPAFTFENKGAEAEKAESEGLAELSEDQICDLVLAHYNRHLEYQSVAPFRGVVVKNENHMVTVCIYEEGYSAVNYRNSPQCWYCINSYTLQGDSTTFGKVDLNE